MKTKLLTEDVLLNLIQEGNKHLLLSDKNYCDYCEKEIPHFHASRIGYCVRRQQYDILNKMYPKKMSAYDATWLRDGMLHEEIIREGLKGSGVKLLVFKANNIKYKDVIIVTHYDIIMEYQGVKYVLEIKSVKDWAWKDMLKTGKVDQRYIEQLMLYMNDHKIEHGFVIIKRRMTSEMLPFYFKLNKKIVTNIFNRQQAILDHNKAQKLIAKPYENAKNFECRKMCPYKEPCWSK